MSKEDPILWANEAVRQRVYRSGGRQKVSRFPQTARGLPRRWRYVVDGNGNVLQLAMTGAAADGDLDGPSARQRRAKHRALGWFDIGRCPVALVVAGELSADHIDEDVRKRQPCAPGTYAESSPCPCALAERDSRRKTHQTTMASRLPRFNDMQTQLKEQATANNELVSTLKDVLETVSSAPRKGRRAAGEDG